jgi:hypothetical protein
MRPIFSGMRRRAGLLLGATVVITGALAGPAFAISVALHHAAGRQASGSGSPSTSDLLWTGGVLLVVALLVGALMFLPRPGSLRLKASTAARGLPAHRSSDLGRA